MQTELNCLVRSLEFVLLRRHLKVIRKSNSGVSGCTTWFDEGMTDVDKKVGMTDYTYKRPNCLFNEHNCDVVSFTFLRQRIIQLFMS